ncbi:hypothetical protein FGADI_12476 [Fusarium gaditjirri]|uniref:Uncharacterized protein n=1 Tax=Fusarium gaditjirri TaxID=282569 RepID=A0A8H4SS25_9HYPO|nr:hypothetical protein FGADI_12476 [Fusarium gaditjirri]
MNPMNHTDQGRADSAALRASRSAEQCGFPPPAQTPSGYHQDHHGKPAPRQPQQAARMPFVQQQTPSTKHPQTSPPLPSSFNIITIHLPANLDDAGQASGYPSLQQP